MKKDFSNGTIPSSLAFLDASLCLIKRVCRPSVRMSLYSYVRPSVHYTISENGKNERFSRLRWQEIILRDTPANTTTTAAAATTTAATNTAIANTAAANTATATIAKCIMQNAEDALLANWPCSFRSYYYNYTLFLFICCVPNEEDVALLQTFDEIEAAWNV